MTTSGRPSSRNSGAGPADRGAVRLVVVESPAKARTIGKYLGAGYRVMATRGHVRDFPAKAGSVNPDDGFAMVYETAKRASTRRNITSTDIFDYNTHVQNAAASGHMDIQTYSAQFKAVASTGDDDARDNTATTGTGVPIYWLNGAKVADNHGDSPVFRVIPTPPAIDSATVATNGETIALTFDKDLDGADLHRPPRAPSASPSTAPQPSVSMTTAGPPPVKITNSTSQPMSRSAAASPSPSPTPNPPRGEDASALQDDGGGL